MPMDPNKIDVSANDSEFDPDSTLAKIESLQVSEQWKQRFVAICQAGGPKLPKLKNLPKHERRLAYRLNIPACLFGPFYYFALGMWKKGIALSALLTPPLLALGVVLSNDFDVNQVTTVLSSGACAVFGIRANIDYYKMMVLGNTGWW